MQRNSELHKCNLDDYSRTNLRPSRSIGGKSFNESLSAIVLPFKINARLILKQGGKMQQVTNKQF